MGPSLADEVERNTHLHELATRHAVDTYAGPLYGGLDPQSWSPAALRRAVRQVVIVSALWGALRPTDRIPSYRLHVCSRLVGMDRLEPAWRTVLPAVLTDAAGSIGPILDLRSRAYQAVGRPAGLDDQTVALRVRRLAQGQSARRRRHREADPRRGGQPPALVGGDPEDPLDLADLLATRWPVEVEPPGRRSRSWTITLEAA